jgi:cephalosporin-C deacetylase-like acetyl esterase
MRFVPRRGLVLASFLAAAIASAQPLKLTPFHASGLYRVGETAGWSVAASGGVAVPAGGYAYTVKENNFTVLKSGKIDPTSRAARIEVTLDEPAMVYLEITPGGGEKPIAAGAAVSPTELKPVAPRPDDFDAFWADKIKWLHRIPEDPVLTPADSGRDGVEYAKIQLNNIRGAHIYGQIAKPKGEGKFPAMLIMQWAGGPYPLQKAWVVDRAAEGWLAMNVEPHDVPFDLPQAFYDALPELIKSYTTIYNDDRERNYFLRMYLGDYRALDYLASRPDWNGKVLLAFGTSMGGQQSLAVAGLHPKVTHVIVHVPAGADALAALHGRQAGYPNWDVSNPKVVATAPYFDTVNFAPNIRATALVSMGFIDTTCPPAGVWTAFNRIAGRKEVVPLVEAGHNHVSTPEQQRAYTERSNAWLNALVHGQEPEVRALTE